ncbi:MAG: ABC transporter ATP-binding protein [Polyangiaceae bacterium]
MTAAARNAESRELEALAATSETITLRSLFAKHANAYVFGAVVLAIFQFCMNRIDWLSKAAVDRIFSESGTGDARGVALAMLGLAVIAFVARVASRWFIFNAGRDVEYELRAILLARLQRLGTAFYRTMSSGEIMSRSTNDLVQVRLLYGFGVLNLVNVVFAFASALQVMLVISLKLSLACLANLPLVMFASRTMGKQMYTRMKANQETLGRMSEFVQSNVAGTRVIRSFALEKAQLARFEVTNAAYLEASLGLARVRGAMFPLMGAGAAIGLLVFFWYGGTLLAAGHAGGGLSEGDFFAFWLALLRMTWPMIALGFSISMVQRGRAGFVRIKEVFDAMPEVSDGPEKAPATTHGDVEVRGLSFAYGKRRVLDGVSFSVPSGTSVAIVGRTGSGKSTLALLLARLLPTPEKTVFVDGHDVTRHPLAWVRGHIGYAQQDAFLFSTTVARNVGFVFDDPDSDEALEKVRAATVEAHVKDELDELPEGIDTVVGERGVQLSGGQKQRVALARALVWKPKVLVLDDPLSAVDAKTEASILQAIERQAAERTVVLVTHRVAAAARCDRIVVLDEGRIVEQGTHDELVKAKGIYSLFAEEQRMARELEELGGPKANGGSVASGEASS